MAAGVLRPFAALPLVKFKAPKPGGVFGHASVSMKDAPDIAAIAENDEATVWLCGFAIFS
jgi:hypothetical protein